MKTGASSLNPYAEPYVPLYKRAGADADNDFSKENGAAVPFRKLSENILLQQSRHQNVSQNDGAMLGGDFRKWKDHRGGKHTSTSQYVNEMLEEKSNFDEDMDLAYLQMTFPGISYESLHGVYLTSRCDLDAAVDMINQLEIHPHESSDKLPDTLDIGDVAEDSGLIQKPKGDSALG